MQPTNMLENLNARIKAIDSEFQSFAHRLQDIDAGILQMQSEAKAIRSRQDQLRGASAELMTLKTQMEAEQKAGEAKKDLKVPAEGQKPAPAEQKAKSKVMEAEVKNS